MLERGLSVGKGRLKKDCHTGLGLGHISNSDCLCTICTEQECWEQLPTNTTQSNSSASMFVDLSLRGRSSGARLSANPPKQDFFFNF